MLGGKQEAKFGGVMSAQNTNHILVFYHIFSSFNLAISVLIALYLILGFFCILGDKFGIWRLCGDLRTQPQRRDVEFIRRPT